MEVWDFKINIYQVKMETAATMPSLLIPYVDHLMVIDENYAHNHDSCKTHRRESTVIWDFTRKNFMEVARKILVYLVRRML